jgi:hypothetical protein
MVVAMYESSVLTIETSLPLGITLPDYRRARLAAGVRRRNLLRRLGGFVAS